MHVASSRARFVSMSISRIHGESVACGFLELVANRKRLLSVVSVLGAEDI